MQYTVGHWSWGRIQRETRCRGPWLEVTQTSPYLRVDSSSQLLSPRLWDMVDWHRVVVLARQPGGPVAEFIDPDWGDKVNSGMGLSYWPARLHWPAGRYNNPMPELTLSPSHGSINSATVQQPYARVDYIAPSGTKNLATALSFPPLDYPRRREQKVASHTDHDGSWGERGGGQE